MPLLEQDPMQSDWANCAPIDHANGVVTARQVACELGHRRVEDLDASLTPYLAAAAAELAALAGISWRFSTDDAPVALLRLMARAAIVAPDVGGPHTERLLEVLEAGPPA